ncbi:MAG: glycosyltransferase family 4 protein [Anditalea sp.]
MAQRILMLHSSSDLYGASRIFLISALILRDSGHRVYIVLSEEGPLAGKLRNEGLEVFIIRLGILRRKYFNVKGLINRASIMRNAYGELVKLVKKNGINHIYSNTSAVLVGAWVGKSQKVFHTWHIHEIITTPTWFPAFMGKIVGHCSDQILVVSDAVKKFWSKYIPDKELKVIYNGIDYRPYFDPAAALRKELSISEDDILIGMIGRVSHWKGQSYFLDLAEKLSQSYPNLVFVIAGDAFPGSEHLYEEMEEQIVEYGLEEKVFTLGFRSDVPEILAALDIFVLPSILPDPLPTVILEAMASGKPVVATAHGGACEMIRDNENGYLIPWKDASMAAAKMIPLIDNKELRGDMGKKGRERVLEHFSLAAFRRNMAKCFPLSGE